MHGTFNPFSFFDGSLTAIARLRCVWLRAPFTSLRDPLFWSRRFVVIRRLLLSAALVSTLTSPGWAVVTHQYTFNDGTANDAMGTANGTLFGGAAVSGGS